MQHPPHGDEYELFQLHNRKLVSLIRNRFRLTEDDARDVGQFAWLKFVEKQPARTNVFGWLYTTACAAPRTPVCSHRATSRLSVTCEPCRARHRRPS